MHGFQLIPRLLPNAIGTDCYWKEEWNLVFYHTVQLRNKRCLKHTIHCLIPCHNIFILSIKKKNRKAAMQVVLVDSLSRFNFPLFFTSAAYN